MSDDKARVRVDIEDRVECEEMTGPLQRPSPLRGLPLQQSQHPSVIFVCGAQVGMVQEEIEIPRRGHGPKEARVHERLVQDREALLGAVHISEVERVDLPPVASRFAWRCRSWPPGAE